MRATLGMRLTAAAVTLIGTMGVAAAAVLPQESADRPIHLASQGFDSTTVATLDDSYYAPTTTGAPVGDPGTGSVGEPSTPPTQAPAPPSSDAPPAPPTTTAPGPLVPPLPVPVLPPFAQPAAEAVNDVLSLLPAPADLQAVVMGCVSELKSLLPAGTDSASASPTPATGVLGGLLNGLGLGGILELTGLGGLGGLAGSIPNLPDLAAVQGAIDGCLSGVVDLLPDPTGLAQALTAVVNGAVPPPVAALVAQLTTGLPSSATPSDLLSTVSGLLGATGGPGGLVDQLVGALDPIVPAHLSDLVGYPFAVIQQLFASLGVA